SLDNCIYHSSYPVSYGSQLMNYWDIIIISLIAVCLFFAVRDVVIKRRNGNCTCSCSECPNSSSCSMKTRV
ncbi:MAG: FeoB-associated Cys-rich membrane protein, partial [Oscillospiraceae bacterium]|nr:FeoB-associated Cys-rich membrane protein [Oscillospiraceae bacterium]